MQSQTSTGVRLRLAKVGASGSLPGRHGHAGVAVDTSSEQPQVYAIGGSNTGCLEVQILNEDLSRWSLVSTTYKVTEESPDPTLTERMHHSATAVGRSIYVFGGVTSGGQVLGDLLELDTESASWSKPSVEGEGPGPRFSHTASSSGSRIYYFGGKSESEVHNDVYILDVVAQRWISPTVLGVPPSPRYGHVAVAANGRIFVHGGCKAAPVGDLWCLEVDTPYVKQKEEELGGEAVVAWSKVATRDGAAKPRPVVICGPSGVGKGTLIGKLMQEFPEKCGFSVSHTTRKPREGEVDGVHYHFTTREVMEVEVAEGKFLEHADVHGNMYGTSIAAVNSVTESGKMCILDIDVQGAQQVKRSPLSALFIFVRPPSFEELEKRLRGRGTEKEEQIAKRLANAKAELDRSSDSCLFDYVMVNGDLDTAYNQLKVLLDLYDEPSPEHSTSDGVPPSARFGHAAALLDNKVLVYGGQENDMAVLSDLHLLEVSTLTGGAPGVTQHVNWLPADLDTADSEPALTPISRFGHSMVTLVDSNKVLVLGGFSKDAPLGDSAIVSV